MPGASARSSIQSEGLDLGRAAALARNEHAADGRLRVDVGRQSCSPQGARGHVLLDLSEGAVGTWNDGQAHVDVELDDRRISGHATASLGDVGALDIQSTDLQIGGADALEWSSWKRAWGKVDATIHVDLAKLAAQLPAGTLPIASASGRLDLKASLQRDSQNDDSPDVRVAANTSGLKLIGAGARGWTLEGLDGEVHAQVDGAWSATAVHHDR